MSLVQIKIKRRHLRNDCIIGELSAQLPFSKSATLPFRCFTLELPWRENRSDRSSIPAGRYGAFVRQDGKRGWRLQLTGTGRRSNIQIHTGNKPREIEGCILIGMRYLGSMVLSSKNARNELMARIAGAGKGPRIVVEITNALLTDCRTITSHQEAL